MYQYKPSPRLRQAIELSLAQLAAVGADPLIHARAIVTLDRPLEAIPLLEELTTRSEDAGQFRHWLPAAVLLGLAHQEAGEQNAALAWLERAVQRASENGHVRVFLDEGEPVQPLLERLERQKRAVNYTKALLASFHTAAGLPGKPGDSGPLSRREREVLRLIARGLTNRQIADQLVIAPSTAKRHVINIYNKLGVNNRAEATARAFEIGIVKVE